MIIVSYTFVRIYEFMLESFMPLISIKYPLTRKEVNKIYRASKIY